MEENNRSAVEEIKELENSSWFQVNGLEVDKTIFNIKDVQSFSLKFVTEKNEEEDLNVKIKLLLYLNSGVCIENLISSEPWEYKNDCLLIMDNTRTFLLHAMQKNALRNNGNDQK